MKRMLAALTLLLIVCTLIVSPGAIALGQRQSPAPYQDAGKLYFFEQFVKNQMEKKRLV